jgi:Pyridoxamine 5'-phosphate oxidase
VTEMIYEVRRLLERPNYAHIATLLPNGAPHSVPVWIDVEGPDEVVILTSPAHGRRATSSETRGWRSRSLM